MVLLRLIMSSSMEKKCYDQPIDSNIKQYKGIRKLTTGQSEDCTTGCFQNYEYVKNHCKLTAANLSTKMELDADPKAIQLIEFVGELKNVDDNSNAANADGTQPMLVLKSLEITKETRLKFFQGSLSHVKDGKL